MKRMLCAISFLALTISAAAQQQPFQEKIDVNAVLLDVVVTDARGNQMLGLGKDDFIVKENGVRQEIDSVDYLTNRTLLTTTEQAAPFKVERVKENRYLVFFFDKPTDPGVLFDQLTVAREAAKDFIDDEMQPTDRIAILGHDTRLKIYSDFTSDKKQLKAALNDATRFSNGILKAPSTEGPSILNNIDTDAVMNRTGTVYEAIDLLADSLKSIPARKNLVLFSPGIMDHEEALHASEMLFVRSSKLDPMLESLNGANVSVYGVQLQRNAAPNPIFHQRLMEMADTTGGRYFQFNTNFKSPLRQIENANSGYYLITYRSRHPKGDHGYQKVDVSVKNPEFKVVSRAGYQY